MENENLKEISKLAKMFGTDRIFTNEQIQEVLTGIFKLLTQFKKENSDLNKDTKDLVDGLLVALLDKHEKWEENLDGKSQKQLDGLQKGIEEIKYLINEFKKIKPKDGDTPDKNEIIQEILEQLRSEDDSEEKTSTKDSEEISGETIVDKINELDYSEENLIDPRRIAGWEDWSSKDDRNAGKSYGGIRAISNAMDVDFAGITDGQVIAWSNSRKLFVGVDQSGGGGGSSTLAAVSVASTDATKSTYTMTSAVNVVFKNSSANTVLTLDEANQRIIVGASSTDISATSSTIALVKNGLALIQAFGYGASGSSGGFFTGYAATGTAGSPGAVTSGSTLAALSGRGYDGTAWTTGSQASILLQAAELWSNTARGTNIVINTTPNTTTTNTGIAVFGQNGNFALGTTTPQVAKFGIAVTRSATNPGGVGFNFQVYSGTFTDTSSSGTVATISANSIAASTIAASSATTYTDAYTLYISGLPVAGTNVTLSNRWSLYVASGQVGFGGAISPITNAGSNLGTSNLAWNVAYLTTIELGNTSDTTISRVAGGQIAVEGVNIMTISSTDTVTNKSINATNNTITNLTTAMFATNVIDTDSTLTANSDTRISSQKAIKSYVDNLVTGLQWKRAVNVASTVAGVLATSFIAGLTIDGYVLVLGDRILIKNQATASENGIYTITAGTPTRTTDADTGAELISATVFVENGTVNGDTQWTCTNDSITLGSTNIVFAQVAGAGTYSAGTGLSLSGNQFSIDSTVATLTGSQALTNKTYNGLTLSSTTGTFTLTNGKTFSVSNTLTFNGTDSSTVAFGAGGTVAYVANNLGVFAASTSAAIGVGTIELGHASDTTLARSSAGVVTIEGVVIDTVSATNTLSNKTLTAPKFASGGFIADANGNELIIFTTTTSAVNEFTFVNAATGNNPAINASGGDSNIGITITGKGTKGVQIGNVFSEKTSVITDGAGAVIDCSLGNLFTWTAGADRTAGTTTNAITGQKMFIAFKASGAGRTLTLPTSTTGDFAYGSDITTLSQTASGKTDVIGCVYDTIVANRWAVVSVVKGY